MNKFGNSKPINDTNFETNADNHFLPSSPNTAPLLGEDKQIARTWPFLVAKKKLLVHSAAGKQRWAKRSAVYLRTNNLVRKI